MLTASAFFQDKNYLYIKCDSLFLIEDCNRYVETIMAKNKADIIGLAFIDFFHNDDQTELYEIFANANRHKNAHYTNRWRKPDGSYLWCHWHLTYDSAENAYYFMGEDVSEQKRVKASLKALESVTNTGYWEIDLDTRHLYWSEHVHRIHETDANTFKPKIEDGISFYHPDSVPTLVNALEQLEKTGKPYSADLKFITSKGKNLIVNARGFSEIDKGRVVRNFGTFQDLTKQKEDDSIRQRLEQRVVLALQAAKIGVWEYDIVNDKLTWDDRLYEIFGTIPNKFAGNFEDWGKTLHPDDLEEATLAFNHSIENHAYFNHVFRVIADNGQIRYVHGMAATIYDNNNNAVKATGIILDLTESELIKNELKQVITLAESSAILAKEMAKKAKAADLQKSVFLANMSHEIRTPISGVIGLVDILLNKDEKHSVNDETRERYLRLIKNSSQHLINIISDILDFSKIEAGKISIKNEHFGLAILLDDLLHDFQIQATDKGLTFDFQSLGLTENFVIGDPFRLKQILYNLLGNAIKFTQKGSVQVRVRLNPKEDNNLNFICSVIDTGIGIAQNDMAILFEPFEQVDSGASRGTQGSGLGLSITQRLVELMQGELTVQSELSVGSNFTVKIPLIASESVNTLALSQLNDNNSTDLQARFGNCRALVAEDNDINQVVIENLLSQLNIECTLVSNGIQALACLSEHPANFFDLILMDCQMPELDGFGATKVIRENSKYSHVKNIPIIALTANAMVGDKEICLQAGMDDYLSKPVNKELLSSTIQKNILKL